LAVFKVILSNSLSTLEKTWRSINKFERWVWLCQLRWLQNLVSSQSFQRYKAWNHSGAQIYNVRVNGSSIISRRDCTSQEWSSLRQSSRELATSCFNASQGSDSSRFGYLGQGDYFSLWLINFIIRVSA
jgi:hypothetical protein